jgi:type I restriction enzyme S subunit
MRAMKDSGIEWIGKIPKDWELSKIGSAYSERNTKVSDTDYKALSVTMNGIVPQLETAAKTDNGDNRKLIRINDFVINSRSDRRGSCGISPYDGSCSLINTVLIPRENMNNAYYGFLFKTSQFADEFYKWGHGIVDDLWSTKWSEMKNIYIPEPSLDNQQRIASFLDSKCAKIDEYLFRQQQVIEKLKEYKQSVITETVTKGLDPDVPMKDSGVEWIGRIPNKFGIVKLKMVTNMVTDGTHQTPNYLPEGVPFLSIKDISSGIINFSNTKFISNETHNILSKHANVEKGDILFTRIGTLGVAVVVETDIKFDIFVSLGLIKPKNNLVISKWLAYYMSSYSYYQYIQLVKAGGGTTAAKFNLFDVLNSKIIVPSIVDQQRIVYYLDTKCAAIDAVIKRKQELIDKMTEYKKSLIYEAVTGKMEV